MQLLTYFWCEATAGCNIQHIFAAQFLWGNFVPPSLQSWEATYTEFGEQIGQSWVLPIHNAFFNAPFWNQTRLGSKIEDKFCAFWPTVNLGDGRAKCLSQFYDIGLGPNPWQTLGWLVFWLSVGYRQNSSPSHSQWIEKCNVPRPLNAARRLFLICYVAVRSKWCPQTANTPLDSSSTHMHVLTKNNTLETKQIPKTINIRNPTSPLLVGVTWHFLHHSSCTTVRSV